MGFKTKFDRLGVFEYSHEENMFSIDDNVSAKVKARRVKEIMNLQSDISYNLNQKKKEKYLKFFLIEKKENILSVETEHDSPDVDNEVLVESKNAYVRIGDFANVIVKNADHFDLYAEIVK